MLTCLWKSFGKFAQIQEVGVVSAKLQRRLDSLQEKSFYKASNKTRVLNSLLSLHTEAKKHYDLTQLRLAAFPEVQTAVEHLPELATALNAKECLRLIRALTNLKITHKPLWKLLETQFATRFLEDLSESDLVHVVRAFGYRAPSSAPLWKGLETRILHHFCPQHNMRGQSVAAVITTYSKLGITSPKFLAALEQQVLRSAIQMNGTDIARVLYSYCKQEVGSPELYKVLANQCKLAKSQMDVHSLVLCLTSFARTRTGTHNLYEALERQIQQLPMHQITLQNISTLLFAYAQHMPRQMQAVAGGGKRRGFVEYLEGVFAANLRTYKYEAVPDFPLTLVNALWGLSVAQVVQSPKLWEYLSEFYNRPEIQTDQRFERMRKDISQCLSLHTSSSSKTPSH